MASLHRTFPARFFGLSALAVLLGTSPCLGATSYSLTDLGRAYDFQNIYFDSPGHVEETPGIPSYPYYGLSKTAGNYAINDETANLLGGIEVAHAYFGVNGQPLTELAPIAGAPSSNKYFYLSGVSASGTAVGTEYNQVFNGISPFRNRPGITSRFHMGSGMAR